ncbi:hypothetical protein T492DRAFT_1067334 [Pavlovales sp. CCMP2436]|nr:hypothetical protein T492DRAFT_1067334 [Pavlovales sp. CCMP2436]
MRRIDLACTAALLLAWGPGVGALAFGAPGKGAARLGVRCAARCAHLTPVMASEPDAEVPRFTMRNGVNLRADEDIDPIGEGPSESDLLSDIARYKQVDAAKQQVLDGAGGSNVAMNVINTLGLILTCNFVIILVLFGWFLVGAIAQLGFKTLGPILAFRAAWDPFIMPLLTTHMSLTILSKVLEKVTGNEAEGSVGGNWDIKL